MLLYSLNYLSVPIFVTFLGIGGLPLSFFVIFHIGIINKISISYSQKRKFLAGRLPMFAPCYSFMRARTQCCTIYSEVVGHLQLIVFAHLSGTWDKTNQFSEVKPSADSSQKK